MLMNGHDETVRLYMHELSYEFLLFQARKEEDDFDEVFCLLLQLRQKSKIIFLELALRSSSFSQVGTEANYTRISTPVSVWLFKSPRCQPGITSGVSCTSSRMQKAVLQRIPLAA